MRWMVVACLALCACSRIFGLDAIGNDDRDGDHVPDEIDNCPNDYNPDQSDYNSDGIGDRCDVCSTATGGPDDDDDGDGIPNECDACDNRLPDDNHDGVPDACEQLNDGGTQVINPIDGGCPMCEACAKGPAHDEDGDLIADACDPCAIDPGVTIDVDMDGVGDTCDASIDRPSHQLFDPFSTLNQEWYQIGTGSWTIFHDSLHISPGAITQVRVLGSGVGHFTLRTRVFGATGTNNDTTISLVASAPRFEAPDEGARCSIVFPMAVGAVPQLAIEHSQTGFSTFDNVLDLATANSGKYGLVLDYNNGILTCTAYIGPSLVTHVLVAPVNGSAPVPVQFVTGISARGGNSNFEFYQMATDD
jgi:hypothetical protein